MTDPQQPDCRTCDDSRIGEWDYTDGVLKSCYCLKHAVHICLDPPVTFDHLIPDCHSSRPAPSPIIQANLLNNQPDGTTCEDCQRFRKESCPYPGSNITMTMCNAFKIDLITHDATIRNQTLDDVRAALSHIRFQDEDAWFIEAAIKKIESLRTSTKEQAP